MATKAQSAEVNDTQAASEGVRRRDFLNVAAVSFAGVGGVAALAPLLVQMAPSADVLAMATTEIESRRSSRGRASRPAGASSRCSCAT